MRHNWERAFSLTLKHEGGYVDHPKDPGGATNLGITIGTLQSWLGRPVTKAEVRALTPEKVKPIYKANYWDKIGGDRMESGFDYACYDFAVNSGPGRAIGFSKNIEGATTEERIKNLCAARLRFLRSLATWPVFGKGWTSRVVAVEREALAMARNVVPPPPDDPGPEPRPQGWLAGLLAALARIFKRK